MQRLESQEFDDVRGKVAVRLRELRLVRGLSQEELADRAGCHRTYVGMLERRIGNQSMQVLTRLANALGVPVYELLHAPSPD